MLTNYLRAGSTPKQLGEIVFAPDSGFSSAVGVTAVPWVAQRGRRYERIKPTRRQRSLSIYLAPGMISFSVYNSVRRIIIFS